MTPRSDLGINSPTFDSRSEISVASHRPVPPDSPRIDPLKSIEALQSLIPPAAKPEIELLDTTEQKIDSVKSAENPSTERPLSPDLTPAVEQSTLVSLLRQVFIMHSDKINNSQ